ncbi:MAG: chromate resistance protein ChrB domain-containing protein [Chloroflexota bacterium]
MSWITFAYSLSSKDKSSARVTLWRRLQRLGAVAPAGNLYLLPAHDDCVESFQWLTQEVQQAGGQAIMAHCDQFEGMSEGAIVALFCAARGKEYESILTEVETLERTATDATPDALAVMQSTLAKLRRQFVDVQRIDYFDCAEATAVSTRLTQLEQKLAGESHQILEIVVQKTADFQNKTWVTRPQPHVDRLSSIWLIRRFIDANPTIRYSHQPAESDISFDMPNAHFGHSGNLCTFETLIHTFQIEAAGLPKLAEIIHEIDLHDGLYNHPEVVGIDAVLRGWLAQSLSDKELEQRGLMLFDGLLATVSQK